MSEFVVAKYGGTSMAQPAVVAELIERSPEQRIIVVSAPGKDPHTNFKITDRSIDLYNLHGLPAEHALRDEIIDRFDTVYDMLGTKDRRGLRTYACEELDEAMVGHNYDHLISRGEAISARGLSILIGAQLMQPHIMFNRNGTVNHRRTDEEIRKWYAQNDALSNGHSVAVTPGFYGQDITGRTWTLGRGGSDRTGVMYPGALGVDGENWTDVNGIYSADPRKVQGAVLLSEVTREEVREGAHAGSGVLQGDAILDLNGFNTIITVRNTFKPNGSGTRVVKDVDALIERDTPIISVTGRDDITQIDIHDMGMALRTGYMAKRLKEFGRLGLAWAHMPTAEDSVSMTLVDDGQDNAAQVEVFAEYLRRNMLSGSGRVTVGSVGRVSVVGEGLRQDPLIHTLATANVLSMAVRNGHGALPVSTANSPSLSFLVPREYVSSLIADAHDAFIENVV